jgi:hypothetical protein
VLRLFAFVIAVAAMIDPALSIERAKPLAVEIATSSADRAARVRDELLSRLRADVSVARPGRGEAMIAIDRAVHAGVIRDGVPVSFVMVHDGPNVQLLRASNGEVFPGEHGKVTVDAAVVNMAGQRSKFTVVQNGIEVGATEHTWSAVPQQQLRVPFVALTSGSQRVQVVAEPLGVERRRDDNILDVHVTTRDRPFSIAFIEGRPSWSARFAREAIETDPRVRVSSLTRVSVGVDIRDARPPSPLTFPALEPLDFLAIGAPEALQASEVEALRAFMAQRGGIVLVLLDRRPSGRIAALLPSTGFDEVLFTTPVPLSGTGIGKGLRASEFAVLRNRVASMETIAALPDGRAVIAAWPIGAGRLVVSGALDAWRYRASPDAEFASFWRAFVTGAARQAPAALSVDIDPPVAPPGTSVRITARVRGTEFERTGDQIQLPSISAVAMSQRDGKTSADFIRLWPASEPGVFRGEFLPSEPRTYTVLARAGRAEAAAQLLTGGAPIESADEREAASVAVATGGVTASADDLQPVVDHLRARQRATMNATVHPMRSGWWVLPFATVLCLEWTIRRRRGER